ncbi:MAG: BatD family protein [Alistipes sp.]|nr:BatD family protein [Alistipes sp.]
MFSFKRLLALLLVFLPAAVSGQRFTFKIDAPSEIIVGEPFRLEFTAHEKVTGFSLPSIANSGLEITGGPIASASSYASVENGVSKTVNSYKYTFILKANSPGTYNIGIASARTESGNLRYTSRPFSLEAVHANDFTQGEDSITDTDIFIRAIADKDSVSMDGNIRIIYKVYSRLETEGVKDIELPSFDGFRVVELNNEIHGGTQDVYESVPYLTVVFKDYLLFPERTGQLVIDPLDMTVGLRVRTRGPRKPSRDPFSDIFRSQEQIDEETESTHIIDKRISSGPLTITVTE